jgi:hypothetical protein
MRPAIEQMNIVWKINGRRRQAPSDQNERRRTLKPSIGLEQNRHTFVSVQVTDEQKKAVGRKQSKSGIVFGG